MVAQIINRFLLNVTSDFDDAKAILNSHPRVIKRWNGSFGYYYQFKDLSILSLNPKNPLTTECHKNMTVFRGWLDKKRGPLKPFDFNRL